tara:strand:- start:442 stop:972 length:531 start_codon:yes stop_codon:yes gene_type:complete
MTIKKGTKYRVKNIQPDWYDMGISKKEFNDKPVENDGNSVFVIGGKIWIYDDKYCDENEVVEFSWKTLVDTTEEKIHNVICGFDGWLFHYYGIIVENGIEVEILTEEEFEKTTKNVINLKHYQMVRDQMERESVVDDLTLKKLFDGYNPTPPQFRENGDFLSKKHKKILMKNRGGQ